MTWSSDDDATSLVTLAHCEKWQLITKRGRRLQSPLSPPPRCSQRPPPVTGNKNILPLCGIMSNDARKAIKFCNKFHSSARVMKGIHRFHLREAGTILRHPAVVFTWWRAAVKGCFFLSLLLFLTVFDGNSVTNASSTAAFWKSQKGCHTWFDLWAHLHPSAVEISCWLNREKKFLPWQSVGSLFQRQELY